MLINGFCNGVQVGLSDSIFHGTPAPAKARPFHLGAGGNGVAQPVSLVGVSQQGLHHRRGDQLGVGDLRDDPNRSPFPAGGPFRAEMGCGRPPTS